MAKHSSHILELARKGAHHRYQELKAEIASLERHFPHLGEGRGSRSAHLSASPTEASPHPPRKRRTMSAAARKKISDAQKARWAKQKGKKS